MRTANYDRWPANVGLPNGDTHTRVRVLVADDGHAWIIAERGELLLEAEGAGELDHQGDVTTIGGLDWAVTRFSGCNCNGDASRLAARSLLNPA